ncbi:MAG: guanylate kinase [Candidatus Uhrbacteria bacterium]
MNPIFVIVGPSGVGKTTLQERLLAQKELKLARVITTTTRKPRPTETEGDQYYFCTPERFQEMLENGGLVEWVESFGRQYGTSREELDRKLAQGPVLMILDMRGAFAIKKLYPDTHILFIDAPRADLIRRIEERPGTTPEDLERRIARMDQEKADAVRADITLMNPDGEIEDTFQNILSYISTVLRGQVH